MKVVHGANIHKLSRELRVTKDKLIDFSSNILPFEMSEKVMNCLRDNLEAISLYPDSEYFELRGAISRYCQCDMNDLILGNGVTELIAQTIFILKPKNALIVGPAYSEYETELKRNRSNIKKFFLKKEQDFKFNLEGIKTLLSKQDVDMIVLCNPNNPTGTLITIEEIEQIVSMSGAYVVIDETYIEFSKPNSSAVSLTKKYKNLIVLRGTSKFFSTPGIRLGYAISKNQKIKKFINLWNINIFASIIGEVMFDDNTFIKNRYLKFLENRSYLQDRLTEIETIRLYSTEANFILCRILKSDRTSSELAEYLLNRGIIIRDAKSFEGLGDKFFRICVLEKEKIDRLILELKNFFYDIQ